MSLTLASSAIAAAVHGHDNSVEAHVCAVCAVLMAELPNVDRLPPVVASTAARSYVLVPAVVYVFWHRFPLPLPPSCAPPHVISRPEVAVI